MEQRHVSGNDAVSIFVGSTRHFPQSSQEAHLVSGLGGGRPRRSASACCHALPASVCNQAVFSVSYRVRSAAASALKLSKDEADKNDQDGEERDVDEDDDADVDNAAQGAGVTAIKVGDDKADGGDDDDDTEYFGAFIDEGIED